MSTQTTILNLSEQYLNAVYQGDAETLTRLFDQAAQVYGVIAGEPYHKTAANYINGVANRQSPASLGEPYRQRVLSVDVLGDIANVRLHSPTLGFDYYLYLTFAKRQDGWKIVNKTFNHTAN